MRTFLVRHGSYLRDHDGGLDDNGWDQARQLGVRLKSQDLGRVAIFSSHTHRTRQTSDVLAKEFSVDEVCFTPILAEDFRDIQVLRNLTNALLDDICASRQRNIDTVIGVSHEPTIQLALAATGIPKKPNEIPPGSFHEYRSRLQST